MKRNYKRSVLSILFIVAFEAIATADEGKKIFELETVVENIVSKNPEIQHYEAEITKASGAVFNAQQLQNPELAIDLGRKESSDSGVNQGQGLAWGISYAQTFEYPGRIQLREAVAKKQVTLAELQLTKFKLALANKAKNIALDLYLVQQNKQSADSIEKKVRSLIDVLSKREVAGPALLLDRKIIEATALSLKHRAIQLSGDVEKLSVELNMLGGFDIPTRYAVTIPNFDKIPLIPSDELLVGFAMENNPDILLKRAELRQQEFRIKLSENEKNPSFTIRPFYNEEDSGELERTIGVGFSVPLPLWNDNSGNIAIERAQASQFEASLNAIERDIKGKLASTYASYKLQRTQLAAISSGAIESLRDSAQEAEKHYEHGAIPVSTYLQLQQQYLDNLSLYRGSKIQILKDVADLEQITGKMLQKENEK